MHPDATATLLTVLLALSAGPAFAAPSPTDSQAPAQPPAAEPSAALPAEVASELRLAGEAVARGDLHGAIARLAPLAAAGTLPAPGLSLLGTLRLETGDAAGALAILEPLTRQLSDPAVLYHAARAALALGRTAEGAAYLERSVALERGTPAARELGLLRGREGDLVAAFELLTSWVASRPDDLEARVAAAYSAVRLRRAPDAETLLSGLPDDQPKVRMLRGELLLLRGQPKAALDTLRPLLGGDDAAEGELRRLLAEAELMLGNSPAAVELLSGRVAGNPHAALLLSRALQQQGDLDGALAVLQPFVGDGGAPIDGKVDGQVPSLLREHGRLLVSLQRFGEAVPVLERATRQDPKDEQAWYALGQALTGSGRAVEGERATLRFKALVEAQEPAAARERQAAEELADPTGAHAREALRLLGEGRMKEALDLARREARLAPHDPRPLLAEARILLVLNRSDEALKAAEAAHALAPESADTLYQRGAVRIALGEQPAAEADLRAALARAPEHTAAMTDLAVLLMVKGQRDEALRLLERVVELRPDDALAASNLERLRRQGGG